MVKFGKEFRKYQVTQWKDSYINYKLLKQEMKTIRHNIDNSKPKSRRTENTTISADLGHPSLKAMELVPEDSIIIEVQDLHSLYNLRFGNELKRFVDLLEKEFRKSYIHFVSQEKELYKKVNGHCYSIEVYKDYNILNIFNEIKELTLTMKLAKQLNCFINDNVMALKKILKKFDKKFHKYFGIIAPKYILTHLTSQNSDLEYLLQFKLIDESTTICENNLNLLLKIYKNLKGKNISINVPINNNNENNVNLTSNNLINIDNKINILKNRINDYLDRIDELTYFKIQYREWFYYAKQKDRLVKNNPKIFENDIYNPVLSSTYHKDSLLEKCISSKNALKEVERSQSPLSHSNKTNLIFIYIQSFIYGTMLTNILPVISNYFNTKITSDNNILFLMPLVLTYLSYLLPYTIYIYVDYVDKNNSFMYISYITSYILLLLSSLLLFFTHNNKSDSTIDFILIIISRILVGFANNQMMNKKYITLYLPKFRLSSVSKKYLIYELLGLVFGPIITLLLNIKSEFEIGVIKYTHFNCIGWYGFFVSIFFGFLHYIFFIKPLSSDFIMVKDESNINGNKYYQRSESEINRKQYIKEQNLMYKKTYNSMKKKQRESKGNNENGNNDGGNLIIRNITNNENKENEKEKNNDDNIIKTNNDLEENLLNNEDENDKNNISIDSNNEANNSLDVSTGGNIALNAKQQNMINEIEKVLEKRNEACNFNDMNQIPKSINSIINKQKISFGYINQNLYLLVFMFFICSLIKSNVILHFIYYLQENLEYKSEIYCLFIFLLGFFQLIKIFFIFPFYQVNYKYRIFMIVSLTSLVVFSASLLINELYGSVYIFIIINICLVLGCNIIDICCSCYLSFILSPEWKICGRNVGHWINFIITGGKIGGGLICMFLCDKEYVTIWVLFGITSAFFICFLLLIFFTRTLKIKGLTRVIRKSAFEINLDN